MHIVVGAVSAVATLAVPFVLASRMRGADGWRDLARPSVVFGVVFAVVLLSYSALEGKTGGGYLQRAAILPFSAGVVALALRVRSLARIPGDDAEGAAVGLSSHPTPQ